MVASSQPAPRDSRVPDRRQMLPPWLQIGIVGLMVSAVVLAYVFRGSDTSDELDSGQIVASRSLFFEERDIGGIDIKDAASGEVITTMVTGEDGFIRSVMRGLARERMMNDMGPELPFELVVWESGLLSLEDPATGRSVALSAFGESNVQAFSRLVLRDDGT